MPFSFSVWAGLQTFIKTPQHQATLGYDSREAEDGFENIVTKKEAAKTAVNEWLKHARDAQASTEVFLEDEYGDDILFIDDDFQWSDDDDDDDDTYASQARSCRSLFGEPTIADLTTTLHVVDPLHTTLVLTTNLVFWRGFFSWVEEAPTRLLHGDVVPDHPDTSGKPGEPSPSYYVSDPFKVEPDVFPPLEIVVVGQLEVAVAVYSTSHMRYARVARKREEDLRACYSDAAIDAAAEAR